MTDINAGPTMPLSDYIEMEKADSNLFWRLDSGHHQNLLDEAIELIEESDAAMRTAADVIRAKEALLSQAEARIESAIDLLRTWMPPGMRADRWHEAAESVIKRLEAE